MEEDEMVTQQLGEKPDASEQAYAPTKEDTGNEAQVDEAATASERTGEASELVTEQGDQTGEPSGAAATSRSSAPLRPATATCSGVDVPPPQVVWRSRART